MKKVHRIYENNNYTDIYRHTNVFVLLQFAEIEKEKENFYSYDLAYNSITKQYELTIKYYR